MEPTTNRDDSGLPHQPGSGDQPSHYQLLGIVLFEEDPKVIEAAAKKRITYIRNNAAGRHMARADKLLADIAAARRCLLDPEKKAAYDADLKAPVIARLREAQRLAKRKQRSANRMRFVEMLWQIPLSAIVPFPLFSLMGNIGKVLVFCFLAGVTLIVSEVAVQRPGLLSMGALCLVSLLAFVIGLCGPRVIESRRGCAEEKAMYAWRVLAFWMTMSLVVALSAAVGVIVYYAELDWAIRLVGFAPSALWLLGILVLWVLTEMGRIEW
jgi:hypothetical protein